MDYVLPNELVDGMIAAGGKKSTVSIKNCLLYTSDAADE